MPPSGVCFSGNMNTDTWQRATSRGWSGSMPGPVTGGGLVHGLATQSPSVGSPEELDPATLVARARDGDLPAFEALVRRYQRSMYALAARMLADPVDAEDVVQDVFVAAWRR